MNKNQATVIGGAVALILIGFAVFAESEAVLRGALVGAALASVLLAREL